LLGLFGLLTLADGGLVVGAACLTLAGVGALVVPRAGRAAAVTWSPDAGHVADVIVKQVLFDHFDLSDAELEALAAVLPEPVRGPAPFWFLLHGGWLVREGARRRHGDGVVTEIRAAMQARLRLKGGNFDGPHWFATLDAAFSRSDAALRHPGDDGASPSLLIARSLLDTNASSPYDGRLGVPADIETQLAACLYRLEVHLAPTVDAIVGVSPAAAAAPPLDAVAAVSAEAGPRERHLNRREGNLLFPADRRVVSPDERAQARADDALECDILRTRAADVVAGAAQEVRTFDATHCRTRLEDLAALMEACGRYGSAETHALREQCKGAALELIEEARHLPASSLELDATWKAWLDGEDARFRRLAVSSHADDFTDVPQDDVPATVCTWSPERIRSMAARLGPDSPQWQQLVPLCVERLLEAEHEGYPEEQVAERLAVLGQPRGVPMGEAARVPA
jgi:hypothetical protein